MTPEAIDALNAELSGKTPQEITNWAVQQGAGKAIVTTNFRPYEAIILHMVAQADPATPASRYSWASRQHS